MRFQIDDINNNLALWDLDADQESDLDQLRFEIGETRGMIEDAKNETHLELEQLRLQIEELERACVISKQSLAYNWKGSTLG